MEEISAEEINQMYEGLEAGQPQDEGDDLLVLEEVYDKGEEE